ncbi:hypothetical protein H4R19_000721, partial [Coemansia spiralis]
MPSAGDFGGRSSQQQQQQQQRQAGDGFDGIFGPADGSSQAGFFGIPDHASSGAAHHHHSSSAGVELEVLSNSSSNTRNEQLRDRLDHRTA